VTADNSFECWLNGQRTGTGDNFHRSYAMNVASALKSGENLIAILAANVADSPNPAGLIGMLTIKLRDGRNLEIPTDATWEAAKAVPTEWNTDWAATGAWTRAMELGAFGMAPWADVQ